MQNPLTENQKKELLELAYETVEEGCKLGAVPEHILEYNNLPDIFSQKAASFVTIKKGGVLRGCIGSTEAHRPLLDDVVQNAFSSAFHDSRFPPVTEYELNDIDIEISILTPQELMDIIDEKDLLKKIRPGIDGVLISNHQHSATFLPQVWQQLPNPRQFLAHLKHKAGIEPGSWPEDMKCFRYQCVKF